MCVMLYYHPLIKLNITGVCEPSQFSITNNLSAKYDNCSFLDWRCLYQWYILSFEIHQHSKKAMSNCNSNKYTKWHLVDMKSLFQTARIQFVYNLSLNSIHLAKVNSIIQFSSPTNTIQFNYFTKWMVVCDTVTVSLRLQPQRTVFRQVQWTRNLDRVSEENLMCFAVFVRTKSGPNVGVWHFAKRSRNYNYRTMAHGLDYLLDIITSGLGGIV